MEMMRWTVGKAEQNVPENGRMLRHIVLPGKKRAKDEPPCSLLCSLVGVLLCYTLECWGTAVEKFLNSARRETMPMPSRPTLMWSPLNQCYDLYLQGQTEQHFSQQDGEAFSIWLGSQASFAFVGQFGRLSVLK